MFGLLTRRVFRARELTQLRRYSKRKNEAPSMRERVREIFFPEMELVKRDTSIVIPDTCDVVIVGGGVMGSAIAYWLKDIAFKGSKIVVIEKDPTYARASTSLSVGGLRQQFSLEENIRMSLYGAEFLRQLNTHLGIEGEPPVDVNFHPYGYLLLATEKGAQTLKTNSELQNSLGAKNVLLTPAKLKNLFPWISTDGIELACLGVEKEGWFDPWSLLCAFRRKAQHLGVEYIHAEAIGFEKIMLPNTFYEGEDGEPKNFERLRTLVIETPTGERHGIKFAVAVIAAGAFSGAVAKMADIGVGEKLLRVPLPVEPRKRYVYCFHCPNGPGLNTPLTVDPTGTYFRRDGLAGNYICGRSPEPEEEPSIDDLSVDHEFFNEKIWPVLAGRVKAFENLKVKSAWAGYYEYNTFDHNGIIGLHPHHSNLCIATGFSGHGIQQAPAVGRAVAELLFDGGISSIDLSRLGFQRFINKSPVLESNIV